MGILVHSWMGLLWKHNIHDCQIDVLTFSYFHQSIELCLSTRWLLFRIISENVFRPFVDQPAKDECDEEDGEEGGDGEQGES